WPLRLSPFSCADNSLFSFKISTPESFAIISIRKECERASGQSYALFVLPNVNDDIKTSLQRLLGVKLKTHLDKYLGFSVPLSKKE
ncbi:hypothetical protein SDJN02_27481, partial [Cucurbita argyrosperma subsp. argyrosperma]